MFLLFRGRIQILRSLITNVQNYQIVTIAGKNEKLKEKFETLVRELNANNRVKVRHILAPYR